MKITKIWFAKWCIGLFICFAGMEKSYANCVLELNIESTIGLAIFDYIERGQEKAIAESCSSILLLINTPGGLIQTTRLIVEKILNSPVPYLCLIYPSGGHAASAGAIIMQACHVSGAMESTTIGAATPVSSGGNVSDDMRKKIINDTSSWVESLVEKRGRNKDFGREIVTEAKSVGAKKAVEIGAIDFLATSKQNFLDQAIGKEVAMGEGQTATVQKAPLQKFQTDTRFKLLDIFAEPLFVYLIFMGSLLLLYFELTHPGVIVPGVVGLMGLVISLMSFHKLDVSWGGLLLMMIGIGFMFAEAFVPSFGALGIGGIISFLLGGVFLFDENKFGYELPFLSTLPIAIGVGILMLLLGRVAFKTRHLPDRHQGHTKLIGERGVVVRIPKKGNKYKVSLDGSLWNAISEAKVSVDQEVIVKKVNKLTLYVTPYKESKPRLKKKTKA